MALGQRSPPLATISTVDGPSLYSAYCAVCHGKDGRGLGPMAKSLKQPPPDLTRIAARRGGNFPFNQIQRMISGDEPLPLGHGTREMPIWGPVFSQVEGDYDFGRVRVYNLTSYLEKIQTK
jgi:mono/diheme cytochrome c family protein